MADGRRALVVEDDRAQRELVVGLLRGEGWQATGVGSAEEASVLLESTSVDVVLSDWKLPGRDGLALLAEVRERGFDVAFVIATAYGTIANAVAAVRQGADDYLTKPFEGEALLLTLERALSARRLEAENRRLNEEVADRDRLVDLVGRAPSMQKVYRRVEKVAATDATILLTGESGTGKELVARALHTLSRRSERSFVPLNCAAIPEGLLEAELYGAEKGSYTGADRQRQGRFEAADGGTLFLDEIGELPLSLQPKLLRALQESKIQRVGGNRELDVDVRVIAATNRDLPAEVREGRFREDLYWRLAVVPIELPPLRDRREDIPRLVEHFAERAARRHGVARPRFPSPVLRRLIDHSWPGNVRELANTVERLILLSDGERVHSDDLPESFSGGTGSSWVFRLPPEGLSFERLEREVLRQALELAAGNRTRAAKLVDLPYKAFLYRLERLGLAAVTEGNRE